MTDRALIILLSAIGVSLATIPATSGKKQKTGVDLELPQINSNKIRSG
jgi:hypothetical protein